MAQTFVARWEEAGRLIRQGPSNVQKAQSLLETEQSQLIRQKLLLFLVKVRSWITSRDAREYLQHLITSGVLSGKEIRRLIRWLSKDKHDAVVNDLLEVLPISLFRHCLFYSKTKLYEAGIQWRRYVTGDASWLSLTKRHPLLALEYLTELIEEGNPPDTRICNCVMNFLVKHDNHLGMNLFKLYVDRIGNFNRLDFSVAARSAPALWVEWMASLPFISENIGPHSDYVAYKLAGEETRRYCSKPLPSNVLYLLQDAKLVSRLPAKLCKLPASINLKFLERLPLEDQKPLLDQYWRVTKNHGVVSADMIASVPFRLRGEEVQTVLNSGKVNSTEIWDFVCLLPYREAKDWFIRYFRDPDSEMRGALYRALGTVTKAANGDLSFLLDNALKSVNDQDPVRQHILNAIWQQPFHRFNDEHKSKLCKLIQETKRQIDLSWNSCQTLNKLIWRLWPFNPKEALELHTYFETQSIYSMDFADPTVPVSSVSDEAWKLFEVFVIARIESRKLKPHFLRSVATWLGKQHCAKLNRLVRRLFSEAITGGAFDTNFRNLLRSTFMSIAKCSQSLYQCLLSELPAADLSFLTLSRIAAHCCLHQPQMIQQFVIDKNCAPVGIMRENEHFCLEVNSPKLYSQWSAELQAAYAEKLIANVLAEISQPSTEKRSCELRAYLAQIAMMPAIDPKVIVDLLLQVRITRHQNSGWPVDWLLDMISELFGSVDNAEIAVARIKSAYEDTKDTVLFRCFPFIIRLLSLKSAHNSVEWMLDQTRVSLPAEVAPYIQRTLMATCDKALLPDITIYVERRIHNAGKSMSRIVIGWAKLLGPERTLELLEAHRDDLEFSLKQSVLKINIAEMSSGISDDDWRRLEARYADLLRHWLISAEPRILHHILKKQRILPKLGKESVIQLGPQLIQALTSNIIEHQKRIDTLEEAVDNADITQLEITVEERNQQEKSLKQLVSCLQLLMERVFELELHNQTLSSHITSAIVEVVGNDSQFLESIITTANLVWQDYRPGLTNELYLFLAPLFVDGSSSSEKLAFFCRCHCRTSVRN
eukprot:Gregarina_sp_Poly_1__2456@NODE_1664_length_3580_cov_121_819243_g1092_i0_p1_GENE_NODE_1664_length_3580_cov_121_819243_g1092_i0NODE_1664_length_3580_cov_121_819243_g1092_i0_p1_ORF_typecomplete_len1064_score147_69Trimer_CC/PF08954_11/0_043DUF905/PF06006_12/0_13S6OS1/PF15676_5/0_3DUF2730/PF10805_8/0_69SlyX/PF04102_12/3_9SlyX/PF04102_12/7_9e02_NODE_1664_length_3580_cov_121_819243_g1092_i03893532